MIYSIISVFLLVTPFVLCESWQDFIRGPKETISVLGFMAIIATAIFGYRLRPFKNKYLLLFWMWCFFTTILNNSYSIPLFFDRGIIGLPSSFFAWKELFYISLTIFTIYCVSSVIPRGDKKFMIGNVSVKCVEAPFAYNFKAIARMTAWCVIIISVYAFIQAIGFDEWFRTYDITTGWLAKGPFEGRPDQIGALSRRVVGTMGNPSILAIWIAMCLPLCLYLRSKIGYIAFLCGSVVIYLTMSATAVIGAVVGIFIYLFFNFKKILLTILITLIPIALIFSAKAYDKEEHFLNPTGRIEVYKETFKILKDKAITGIGLGTFEHVIGGTPAIVAKLGNQSWKEMHNEYGQIWWSVGLIGLMLFLCFVFTSIRQFFNNINPESAVLFASLSAFMVMSIPYFTMRVAPISFYGAIFLGLFLRTMGDKK